MHDRGCRSQRRLKLDESAQEIDDFNWKPIKLSGPAPVHFKHFSYICIYRVQTQLYMEEKWVADCVCVCVSSGKDQELVSQQYHAAEDQGFGGPY